MECNVNSKLLTTSSKSTTKKSTWHAPADGHSNPRYQQRNTQPYAPRFANPNGLDLGVSQTALGNPQAVNDNDKYAAKRSNIPSNYSETAEITNVYVKLRENCLIHAFLSDTYAIMLVDTGSFQSIVDAECHKTLLYTNPITPFSTQLRGANSKPLVTPSNSCRTNDSTMNQI